MDHAATHPVAVDICAGVDVIISQLDAVQLAQAVVGKQIDSPEVSCTVFCKTASHASLQLRHVATHCMYRTYNQARLWTLPLVLTKWSF